MRSTLTHPVAAPEGSPTTEATTTATTATTAAAVHVAASNAACERFFADGADDVARACHALATRFLRGGRLLAYGEGAQRSDVAHVVVEFVHPVIVGKRALPALALESPEALDVLGRPDDALIVLAAGPTAGAAALLERAAARGLLVLVLTGTSAGSTTAGPADFRFVVPSDDPLVVQETHEMLYHVLWELVHVFFEHRAA